VRVETSHPSLRSALSVRGADLSFTPQLEAAGVRFSDKGVVQPVERIFARYGATYVRQRVWVDPPAGYSDEAAALGMALRAKQAGMNVLLDLHYSDFWADPMTQTIPASWSGQDLEALATSVHDYTRRIIATFAENGAPVDMVAIGNEISNGMLWPIGKIQKRGGAAGSAACATLLKAGIAGAREGNPNDRHLAVMIHSEHGGSNKKTRAFFDRIVEHGVEFDVIGLSYYPFWRPIWGGPLARLEANLNDIAGRYGKPIVAAEVSYPWTLDNGDEFNNLISRSFHLPERASYPPTPEGQAAFYEALRQVFLEVPDDLGTGFIVWEPEWLPGVGHEPGSGNPMDNLTMFDWNGAALPSLAAFGPPDPAS